MSTPPVGERSRLGPDDPGTGAILGPDRLAGKIRDLVRDEGFAPGERIGTERGLAAAFGVERSRVRRALDILERDGEIRRTMGRFGGVFASDGKVTRCLDTIQGVPAMLRQQGHAHATRVLAVAVGVPTARERRLLRLDARDAVVRVERRREASGSPLSLDSMSVPAGLVPRWAETDFGASFYELLRTGHGIAPARAVESIDLVVADSRVAEILEIAVGAPLFQVRRLTFDADGRPIELARDLFRADRTRISADRVGADRVGHSWKRAARG